MDNQNLKQLLDRYEQGKETLLTQFKLYKKGRQTRLLITGIFKIAAIFLGLLLIFMLLERTPIQSEFVRNTYSVLFYIITTISIYKVLRALFNPPIDTHLAVEIEQSTKKYDSGLSTSAEFLNDCSESSATSETFKKLTIASIAQKFKPTDVVLSLSSFSLKKPAIIALSMFFIAAVWFAFSPVEFRISSARMLIPFLDITPYTALEFEIKPGDDVVAQGENIQIIARPSFLTNDSVLLNLYAPSGTESNEVEMFFDTSLSIPEYSYTLNSLQESVDYKIVSGNYTSERYSIDVIPRPVTENIQLTVRPPEYISTEPLLLPANRGDAEVAEGSSIKIEVTASQKLSDAAIIINNASHSVELTSERTFEYMFEPEEDVNYSLYLKNERGLINEDPLIHSIKVIKDMPPTVEILQPARDMPFPESRRLDIKAIARDDFGIRSMVLYYMVGNRRSYSPLNLKPDITAVKEYEVDFPWMLDTMRVQPGVKISYYIEVRDNKRPEPNIASTSIYFVNMPSKYDIYRGEEVTQQELRKKLDEYINIQKLQRDALMEAYEQIRHERELDYESRKTIEEAIEQAQHQQERADEITQQFENLVDRIQQNPFSSSEVLERIQKVSELLNQTLDEESKKMIEQLQQAIEQIELNPEDLEKFEQAFTMDEYIQDLDRTIELLTQVREMQKLNALSMAVEDLLERQKQIASQTADLIDKKAQQDQLSDEDKALSDDLASQQEKIAQELEQLQKQSEEMTDHLTEQDFRRDSLLDQIRQMKDKMQESDYRQMSEDISQNFESEDLDSAQENQEQMLQFLQSLQENAGEISEQFAQLAPQIDLSEFIRRALQVSFDQEKVYNQLEGIPGEFLRGQRPQIEGIIDQASVFQVLIRQQANELKRMLENYIRTSFHMDPDVLTPVRGTIRILNQTVKNLEDRHMKEARDKQLQIIKSYNDLAAELMRTQEQASSSSGDSMCPMQQFQNLTQRQLSLHQEMMKKQSMQPNQQMLEELKQMSMRQRRVREALEQLMRESGEQMQTLGRLDEILRDMLKLETEILDPELRREVADQQRDIYERMLRAQQSIRDRDEESEERRSTPASEIIQQDPDLPAIDPGVLRTEDMADYLRDLREEYPEAYRQIINDYFRALSIYGDN